MAPAARRFCTTWSRRFSRQTSSSADRSPAASIDELDQRRIVNEHAARLAGLAAVGERFRDPETPLVAGHHHVQAFLPTEIMPPSPASEIKAIFWDNDGVLVETEHLYFQATR